MCIEIVNSMGAPNHIFNNFVKSKLVTNLFEFVHVFKKKWKYQQNRTEFDNRYKSIKYKERCYTLAIYTFE